MDALDIISLDSAKKWLNIEFAYTDEDETIERLIKAAVDWVEKYTCWRTFQRTEIVYNQQIVNYIPEDYFPDYGTGFYTGAQGFKCVPGGFSIYLYPFSILSVQDLSSPPVDAKYTTTKNALKTLVYTAPNSVITLQTGFAPADISKIPPPLIEAAYKWLTYLYENRDSYKADLPTDIQILINQYRRALI